MNLLKALVPASPVTLRPSLSPSCCDSGHTLVHPFRALGKNSELLLVSQEDDTATWQRSRLALHWASGPPARTETEANHIRFVQAGPTGTWHPRVHQCRLRLQVTRTYMWS